MKLRAEFDEQTKFIDQETAYYSSGYLMRRSLDKLSGEYVSQSRPIAVLDDGWSKTWKIVRFSRDAPPQPYLHIEICGGIVSAERLGAIRIVVFPAVDNDYFLQEITRAFRSRHWEFSVEESVVGGGQSTPSSATTHRDGEQTK